ncbi:uncharacterized protein LOC135116022 [Scylla paramamosain]|uniref:uncharacterized protein LOC135116022 n=1 Tax=Scylla paramamosain TaxID=85552 RepID=UPI003083392B
MERLGRLFALLEEKGIKLNLTKCDLVKQEVKFLGHRVSKDGSTPDQKNLEAIREQVPPKNVKQVRRFIGMCGFYRKFVPNFSKIAMPLTNLMKGDVKFSWTDECQVAFEALQTKLMSTPILASYQPELPLVLVTDASDECVGAVLHQVQPDKSVRPLGYYSKKIRRKIAKATLDQFEVLDGVLHYVRETKDGSLNYTVVVPRHLVRKALEVAHDQSGHFGQFKSLKQAEGLFYWPTIKSDVIQYLKECLNCQKFKHNRGMSQPYRELPIVSQPLERIAIDLTDMTNGQEGQRYILTIIDHFSRYVKFYPLKTKHAQGIVAKLSQYISDFGRPLSILCDNALEFTGRELRTWAGLHGIELLYTTPYHPQSNGLIKRMHRTLKTVLSQMCKGYPLTRQEHAAAASLPGKARNMPLTPLIEDSEESLSTLSDDSHWQKEQENDLFDTFPAPLSLAPSHFPKNFSHPSLPHNPPRFVTAPLLTVQSEDSDVQQLKRMIKDASVTSQRRYRAVANRKRRDEKVSVGSLVWVKSETPLPGTSTKLNAKWKGPYRVSEVIWDGQLYVVEDPYSGKLVQRAAEKVKPYVSRSEIIPELEENYSDGCVEEEEKEDQDLPPRRRRPPRRLIEEC